jgi:hypothetical protein
MTFVVSILMLFGVMSFSWGALAFFLLLDMWFAKS